MKFTNKILAIILMGTLTLALTYCSVKNAKSVKISFKKEPHGVTGESHEIKNIPSYYLLNLDSSQRILLMPKLESGKSFLDSVSPLSSIGDWGYVDHSGFMMLNTHFRETSLFYNPAHKLLNEFSPSYFGPWWKHFIDSIK